MFIRVLDTYKFVYNADPHVIPENIKRIIPIETAQTCRAYVNQPSMEDT